MTNKRPQIGRLAIRLTVCAAALLAGCHAQDATQESPQALQAAEKSDLRAALGEGGLQMVKLRGPDGTELIYLLDAASANLTAYMFDLDQNKLVFVGARNLLLDFETEGPGQYVIVPPKIGEQRQAVYVMELKTKRIVAYVLDPARRRLRLESAGRDLRKDFGKPATQPSGR